MLHLLFYLLIFLLLAFGCERNETTLDVKEPYFKFSLYEKDGSKISNINKYKANNIEIDDTYSLWSTESSTGEKNSELHDVERPSEIILHAESENANSVDHITLVFRFDEKGVLTPGKYSHATHDKSTWAESVEELWNMRQKHQKGLQVQNGIFQLPVQTESNQNNGRLRSVSYLESGFEQTETTYLYSALQGSVNINKVDETKIKGDFSISLAGVRWEIFENDEFNENFDSHEYRAIGSFVAERSSYNLLEKINADLTPLEALNQLWAD